MGAVVFVERPEIEIAFQDRVLRLPEQWPETVCGFSFTARENDERPRSADFPILFFPIHCDGESEGPRGGRRMTLRRALVAVDREQCLMPIGTFRSQPKGLVEKDRPEQRKPVMPSYRFHFVCAVGSRSHVLVFVCGQRPDLPPAQRGSMAEVKEWIKVIVRHDISLPRLAIQRKQDKPNFIAEKPVFQAS